MCTLMPANTSSAKPRTEANLARQQQDFSRSCGLAAKSRSQAPDKWHSPGRLKKGLLHCEAAKWRDGGTHLLQNAFSRQITFARLCLQISPWHLLS